MSNFQTAKDSESSLFKLSNQLNDATWFTNIDRADVYKIYVIAHLQYPSGDEYQGYLEKLELNQSRLHQTIKEALANIRDGKVNFVDVKTSFIDLTESLYVAYSSGRTKTTRLLIASDQNALRGCYWNHDSGQIIVLDEFDPRIKMATAMDRNNFGRTADGAQFEIKHKLLRNLVQFSNKNSYLLNFLGKRILPRFYNSLVNYILASFRAKIVSTEEQFNVLFHNKIFMNDYADWNRATLSRIKLLVQETESNLYLTLHDDIVYRKPYFFPEKRVAEFMSVLDLARVATCVFAPSSTVKEYIVKHFEQTTQIVVVQFSGSHVLEYCDKNLAKEADEQISFLHFLGNDPRKNSVRTLTAFLTLAKKGYKFKLHIVGPKPKIDSTLCSLFENLSALGIELDFFKDLSEESLSLLYQRSDCLVYCSLDEGFGLPIAEAGAIGCTVITSNFGSMLEVGQRYRTVVFVNPYQTQEIENALLEFMDSPKRQILVKDSSASSWRSAFELILKSMGVKEQTEV